MGRPPPVVPRRDIFPVCVDELDPNEPASNDAVCIRDGVAEHKLALTLCQPTVDRVERLLALCQISVTRRTLGRKRLDLFAKEGLSGPPKVCLTGSVEHGAAESELLHEDPAQSIDDAALKGSDEWLRAGREEGLPIGVSGIEVLGNEERVGDDFARVWVLDDGEGVQWVAIALGAGGGRTDLLGERLDVWVLHPLGLVGETLDVECVSAVASSFAIFIQKGGLTSSSMCWVTTL